MPAEHLFYFTEQSLRLIFEKVGFSVVEFVTKGLDIPDIYSYYRDEKNQLEVAEFLKENNNVLQAMIDAAGCSNHMRFIVKNK